MATKKSKLTLKPPPPAVSDETQEYPWEQERVRDDIIRQINLKLSEPYVLKLQYISKQTRKSQLALIRECLIPFIDEQIEELTRE